MACRNFWKCRRDGGNLPVTRPQRCQNLDGGLGQGSTLRLPQAPRKAHSTIPPTAQGGHRVWGGRAGPVCRPCRQRLQVLIVLGARVYGSGRSQGSSHTAQPPGPSFLFRSFHCTAGEGQRDMGHSWADNLRH